MEAFIDLFYFKLITHELWREGSYFICGVKLLYFGLYRSWFVMLWPLCFCRQLLKRATSILFFNSKYKTIFEFCRRVMVTDVSQQQHFNVDTRWNVGWWRCLYIHPFLQTRKYWSYHCHEKSKCMSLFFKNILPTIDLDVRWFWSEGHTVTSLKKMMSC